MGKYNFGNVAGSVNINEVKGDLKQAGGDIVDGDKITHSGNTSSYNGFKQEEDKQQFIAELEKLRTAMRSIRDEIAAAESVDEDDKDEMFSDLLEQIKALKEAKEQAGEIPVGEEASEEQSRSIGDYIEQTGEIMDRAEAFGESVGELSLKLAPLIATAQPALMTLKSLFGL